MSSFILIDELVDFTNELIELMKEDWKNFKLFIKEYKKYMFWILVLFITMQFTDLMSLGTSWERYCKKNDNNNIDSKNIKYNNIKKIQTGGAAAVAVADPSENIIDAPVEKTKKEIKTDRKSAIKQMAKQKAFGKDRSTSQVGSESKLIAKKLEWFTKFKSGLSPNLGSGSGPIFGNIDRIFKYTESVFIVVTSLLIILGVISLPVIIFIIVAYCVLKTMISKFTIL